MSRFNVSIPSSNRWLKSRSLEQLEPLQNEVDIFYYVPPEQESAYVKHMPSWVVVVPAGGYLHHARRSIIRDNLGEDVVMMDDDIPWFVGSLAAFPKYVTSHAPKTPKLNVLDVATLGFKVLDAEGLNAWGVYPVPYSGTALKPRVGVGTVYLCGGTIGLRVPADGMGFKGILHLKEDYEMSARLIDRDGAVVRLDCICPYTTVGAGSGGMSPFRTVENEGAAVEYLTRTWPQYFTQRADREGIPQVKMVTDVRWSYL